MTKGKQVSLTTGTTDGELIWLACDGCNTLTEHRVLTSVRMDTFIPGPDIQMWEDAQITQCQGCKGITFRKTYHNLEDIYVDDDGQTTVDEREELFPKRQRRKPLEETWSLPQQVRKVYLESCSALANDQPILTGIGIRALLETVCKEKNAVGKDLAEKIDDLVPKGFIGTQAVKFLHATRLLGNLAAHEVEAHSIKDLCTALEIVEHLLVGVYVLPEKAAELPKRKPKAQSAKESKK